MVKFAQNMARPRQWRKKFTGVHQQLKSAYNSYISRRNNILNSMAVSRLSSKYKKGIHKSMSLGKMTLNRTRTYNAKGKKTGTYGGKKIWKRRVGIKFVKGSAKKKGVLKRRFYNLGVSYKK